MSKMDYNNVGPQFLCGPLLFKALEEAAEAELAKRAPRKQKTTLVPLDHINDFLSGRQRRILRRKQNRKKK